MTLGVKPLHTNFIWLFLFLRGIDRHTTVVFNRLKGWDHLTKSAPFPWTCNSCNLYRLSFGLFYERNTFGVPREFAKVWYMFPNPTAFNVTPTHTQLALSFCPETVGEENLWTLPLCKVCLWARSTSRVSTTRAREWRKRAGQTRPLFASCVTVSARADLCMSLQHGSDGRRGKGGNAASLNHGAEPKATKVGLDLHPCSDV